MKVRFIERVICLKDMEPGQFAVSRDRTEVFACGYAYDKEQKKLHKVILKLNKLSDQYPDEWDDRQSVKLLNGNEYASLQISGVDDL